MFNFLKNRKTEKENKRIIEESKRELLDQKALQLLWPSWSVYRETVGQADWQDWKRGFHPDNIYRYLELSAAVVSKAYRFLPEESDRVTFNLCALGDNYLEYLKQEKVENTLDSQVAFFGDQPDPGQILSVLRQSGAGTPCSLYAVPVAVTKPDPETETSYRLNPDEKRVLTEGLERYYGKGNVYVSRYILDFENVDQDGHRICDLGRTYFETGSEALLMKFDTQKCLGFNRELFFISYVVKRPIEKIHFTLRELQEGTKRFASEGVLADIPEITDVAKKVFFDASWIELPDTPMLVNANSLF